MKKILLFALVLTSFFDLKAQTGQDSLEIIRISKDYLESQHTPNPKQMENALHPRMVKRTVWKDKATQKEYIDEYFAENMVILAERYNVKGDKFPKNPRIEVKLLDVSDKTASVKLLANEWIDYMHLAKINGQWKIINVLWQYNDSKRHQG